jgi:hypothetical protein
MGEYNRVRFQELLKKGVGYRSQREFAAQVNMSAPQVNRLMVSPAQPCPKIKTLETLAEHFTNVSLGELMEACGYDMESVEDRIKKVESDISDFFAFGEDENTHLNTFPDLTTLLTQLKSFLKCSVTSIDHEEPARATDGLYPCAERSVEITVEWAWDSWACTTSFHMYYSVTTEGRHIFFGTDLHIPVPGEGYTGRTHVRNKAKKKAADRLYRAIFGEDDWYMGTYEGWGFEYELDQESFLEFLNAHAGTFCTDPERATQFAQLMDGISIADVFKVPEGASEEECAGEVIALILKAETGEDFRYYHPDHGVPEDIRCGTVMVRVCEGNEDIPRARHIPHKLRDTLYQAARVLKVEEFGAVYYPYKSRKQFSDIYKTNDFWYIDREVAPEKEE